MPLVDYALDPPGDGPVAAGFLDDLVATDELLGAARAAAHQFASLDLRGW